MYWEKIKYSFFTYPEWYKRVHRELKDGDIFIEIGTWTGASALFFAELLIKSGKKVRFITMDTFEGSEEHFGPDAKFSFDIKNNGLWKYFMEVREPLKDYIEVRRCDSQLFESSKDFNDNSISAIFIDGDHSYSGVKKDLENWYPKIKPGGIVSGHDYIWGGKGVKPVVDSFSVFRATQFWQGDVWFYYK
jgi:predicted O-methyltransferase YrrM